MTSVSFVNSISFLSSVGYLEVLLCLAAVGAIVARKQWADYWCLAVFLLVRASSDLGLEGLLHAAGRSMTVKGAYGLYFYLYWLSYALEAVLALGIIYSVFRLAMAPLKGLQSLGMLVFRWAAAISIAVALGSAFGQNISRHDYIVNSISQLQRTQSILTLCLLLFVCFAVRPMGLSYSSRIFGVSLGLGILSAMNLVQSAFLTGNIKMGTTYNLIDAMMICGTLILWTAYFAFPEEQRRMIVLPTTSPFLRWNQISQALGDSPGFVAIGGMPHEVFAPAELEVMRRASLKVVTPFPKSMRA